MDSAERDRTELADNMGSENAEVFICWGYNFLNYIRHFIIDNAHVEKKLQKRNIYIYINYVSWINFRCFICKIGSELLQIFHARFMYKHFVHL